MHYSPSFWVAVSFFIFVCSSWYFVRKAFLNIINQYRNSISTALGEILAQKEESHENLELSIEKLNDSNSNYYVLNAHKTAQSIMSASEAKLALLKKHIHSDGTAAIKAFEEFIYKKMKAGILEQSSSVFEQYVTHHSEEFNNIAIAKTIQFFANTK
jgi:F0F1-type ATP synthase membrane subunit b/b'